MQEPMRSLIEIQRLDDEMRQLREEKAASESGLRSEIQAVEAARTALAETEEKVKSLQMVVDKRNVELSALEGDVRKLEGQKMTLRTNEEYATMQKQIDSKQNAIAALEERILESMEVVDKGRKDLPPRQAELRQREAALAKARERVDQEKAVVDGRIETLQQEWDAIAKGMDSDIVSRYVRIRDHRGGRGLAVLSPDNKCQECFMTLRLQLQNEVMRGVVIECPSCGRLLCASV